MRRLIQLVIPCVLLSGCFGPGEGVEVPQDEIYFPVGLAVDGASKNLFVVSSDFDLQYNGGAVQSYDLDKLEAALPQRCSTDLDCEGAVMGSHCQRGGMCAAAEDDDDATPCQQDDRTAGDRLLFPGRCNPIDPKPLQVDTVKIGAFATDAILRARPLVGGKLEGAGASERLFVPVRGDSTLHWLDLDDGKLECGQAGNGACNEQHRAGNDTTENVRGLKLNAEPFAIDADAEGRNIVVTNQTTGTASLFTNSWQGEQGPKLAFALASDRIPRRPVGVAAVPRFLTPQEREDEKVGPEDAFMLTFRDSAQVRLVRFNSDGGLIDENDQRPYLIDGGGVGIDANSVGSDSRGIAIDGSARKNAKERCAADDSQCLDDANLVPLDVYVANRAPSTLLIGRTRPPQEYPYFFDSIALTAGPSRVIVGQVTTPSGATETRVFVACFDSRRIFVYDPQRSRIETEILTGRGPHAMVVDQDRQLLYVGHFTDSYVGVYSLNLAFPATYGTMLGTLGNPKSPRASK
jgi:DNA-binding beta-propeller fold protein YncE